MDHVNTAELNELWILNLNAQFDEVYTRLDCTLPAWIVYPEVPTARDICVTRYRHRAVWLE